MPARELTDFERVLLGLICRGAASGYDLKRAFASTPLGIYEPSSGALYPALRRLEDRGLIHAQPEHTAPALGRRRRVLHATAAGEAEHRRWLGAPVAAGTVSRDLALHIMRFALMDGILTPAEVTAFLRDLQRALSDALAELDRYLTSVQLPAHAQLALEHGLMTQRATLAWIARTTDVLSDDAAPESS